MDTSDIIIITVGILLIFCFVIQKYVLEDNKKQVNKKQVDETENISLLELIKRNKIKTIVMSLMITIFFLLNFVIGLHHIVSGSMEPTYMTHDRVISFRLQYLFSDVERGDIIFFKSEEYDGDLMSKRVIGLPGETVSFKDGCVYINDEKLDEAEYLEKNILTIDWKTYTVPEDSYFVLGDNRENSADSRWWENPYVHKKSIKGKAIFVIPISGLFIKEYM